MLPPSHHRFTTSALGPTAPRNTTQQEKSRRSSGGAAPTTHDARRDATCCGAAPNTPARLTAETDPQPRRMTRPIAETRIARGAARRDNTFSTRERLPRRRCDARPLLAFHHKRVVWPSLACFGRSPSALPFAERDRRWGVVARVRAHDVDAEAERPMRLTRVDLLRRVVRERAAAEERGRGLVPAIEMTWCLIRMECLNTYE